MKTHLFQSCGHCWVFQICWHIDCSTLTASSFRIWNSSIGIPSPPLALFVVILPKACLTSHSRMSGSRWVITPLWLSGSWRSSCIVDNVTQGLKSLWFYCLYHYSCTKSRRMFRGSSLWVTKASRIIYNLNLWSFCIVLSAVRRIHTIPTVPAGLQ